MKAFDAALSQGSVFFFAPARRYTAHPSGKSADGPALSPAHLLAPISKAPGILRDCACSRQYPLGRPSTGANAKGLLHCDPDTPRNAPTDHLTQSATCCRTATMRARTATATATSAAPGTCCRLLGEHCGERVNSSLYSIAKYRIHNTSVIVQILAQVANNAGDHKMFPRLMEHLGCQFYASFSRQRWRPRRDGGSTCHKRGNTV